MERGEMIVFRRFKVLVSATHIPSTIFLLLCLVLRCSARDTITPGDGLHNGGEKTLVSASKIFELEPVGYYNK